MITLLGVPGLRHATAMVVLQAALCNYERVPCEVEGAVPQMIVTLQGLHNGAARAPGRPDVLHLVCLHGACRRC